MSGCPSDGGLRVDSGAARWWKGARAGRRVDRRGSYASSGPGWKIQEVSRVGAQGVTSKSKLLAREMPDLHTGGLWVDSGAARWRKGARAGQRVDRRGSYAFAGPGWKIQEVSRVGAQAVTSKSKLLVLRCCAHRDSLPATLADSALALPFQACCGRTAPRTAPSRGWPPPDAPRIRRWTTARRSLGRFLWENIAVFPVLTHAGHEAMNRMKALQAAATLEGSAQLGALAGAPEVRWRCRQVAQVEKNVHRDRAGRG